MAAFPAIKSLRLEIFSSIGCSSMVGNLDGDEHGNDGGQDAGDGKQPDEAEQREERVAPFAPQAGKLGNHDRQRHEDKGGEQQNDDAPAYPGLRFYDNVGHVFTSRSNFVNATAAPEAMAA